MTVAKCRGSKYFCSRVLKLPVKHRVTYKMAALTFKMMSSSTPAYLNDLIQKAVPVRPLRSSDAPLLIVPRTRTEFARRSFSVAAPHTWNSLPSDVRSCRTMDTFKRHLKTHFSDSLNLTPPAPLYLRTLWRYTNAVIIIIIIIMNGWYEDLLPLCLEFLNQKLVWLILNLRFYICEFELCFLSMMNDGTFCRQVTVDSVLHSYSLIV